jgi:hypothetical protein
MKVELWVGVAQGGWIPVIWIPMKWDPEGFEAKGRGLDIKQYQAQCNQVIAEILINVRQWESTSKTRQEH